ncbi:MAG: hypothetical protein ACI4TT_01395 [Christensenellales bacterium]
MKYNVEKSLINLKDNIQRLYAYKENNEVWNYNIADEIKNSFLLLKNWYDLGFIDYDGKDFNADYDVLTNKINTSFNNKKLYINKISHENNFIDLIENYKQYFEKGETLSALQTLQDYYKEINKLESENSVNLFDKQFCSSKNSTKISVLLSQIIKVNDFLKDIADANSRLSFGENQQLLNDLKDKFKFTSDRLSNMFFDEEIKKDNNILIVDKLSNLIDEDLKERIESEFTMGSSNYKLLDDLEKFVSGVSLSKTASKTPSSSIDLNSFYKNLLNDDKIFEYMLKENYTQKDIENLSTLIFNKFNEEFKKTEYALNYHPTLNIYYNTKGELGAYTPKLQEIGINVSEIKKCGDELIFPTTLITVVHEFTHALDDFSQTNYKNEKDNKIEKIQNALNSKNDFTKSDLFVMSILSPKLSDMMMDEGSKKTLEEINSFKYTSTEPEKRAFKNSDEIVTGFIDFENNQYNKKSNKTLTDEHRHKYLQVLKPAIPLLSNNILSWKNIEKNFAMEDIMDDLYDKLINNKIDLETLDKLYADFNKTACTRKQVNDITIKCDIIKNSFYNSKSSEELQKITKDAFVNGKATLLYNEMTKFHSNLFENQTHQQDEKQNLNISKEDILNFIKNSTKECSYVDNKNYMNPVLSVCLRDKSFEQNYKEVCFDMIENKDDDVLNVLQSNIEHFDVKDIKHIKDGLSKIEIKNDKIKQWIYSVNAIGENLTEREETPEVKEIIDWADNLSNNLHEMYDKNQQFDSKDSISHKRINAEEDILLLN